MNLIPLAWKCVYASVPFITSSNYLVTPLPTKNHLLDKRMVRSYATEGSDYFCSGVSYQLALYKSGASQN